MVLFYQIIEKKRVFEFILTFWLVFGQIGNGLPPPLKDSGLQESGDDIEVEEVLFLNPNYLPLQLGNRWIYERMDSRFKRTERVKIEIIARPIIRWTTYYAFNQLPFVPGLEGEPNLLIRYDQSTQRFVRLIPEGQDGEEVPLFPADGSTDANFDHSLENKGCPVANRLSYLTCSDCENIGLEIVFDRGLGIVEVGTFSDWGSEFFRLKSALVNGQTFGNTSYWEESSDGQSRSKTVVTQTNPLISLHVKKKKKEVDLLLSVKNTTNHFLGFNFLSSQTYDFFVREKNSGFEVWRWSKDNFFTQVIRSQALLPQKEWKFKVVWNLKDNERNKLKLGVYEVVGILTSQIPRQSSFVEIILP